VRAARKATGAGPTHLLVAVMAVSGCGESPTNASDQGFPSVSGSWVLQGPREVAGNRVHITLVESPVGFISGAGTWATNEAAAVPLELSWGLYNYPFVRLDIVIDGDATKDSRVTWFEGTMAKDGSMIVGGFLGDSTDVFVRAPN